MEFEKGVALGKTGVDDEEEAATAISDVVGNDDEAATGASDALGDDKPTDSAALDITAGVVDAGDTGAEDDPKAEETLDLVDATAAVEDSSPAGFTCCEPPQFLPVGFPQPLPPATGHHSGSGSLGDQSVMGGDISESYCGL